MRFASLGSGSSGNALIVQSQSTCLMVDCGFGLRDCVARLARLGLAPQDLTAILVTHEHGDHVGGVVRASAAWDLPVYLTQGTLRAIGAAAGSRWQVIDSHAEFAVEGMSVQPFPVPHDAREPVQFVFSDGARRLGLLTDTGSSTPHIRNMLSGCDALVLECNHDAAMLATGRYPPSLKARIGGHYGHLANEAAAALLSSLDVSRLRHLVAAHLSRENNHPMLVRTAMAGVLGCSEDWVGIASQEEGFDWLELA